MLLLGLSAWLVTAQLAPQALLAPALQPQVQRQRLSSLGQAARRLASEAAQPCPLPSGTAVLPKIVWLYWASGWPSDNYIIESVRRSWRFHNPGWEVRTLDDRTLMDYVDAPYLARPEIKVQAKSDIIRVSLLAKHGGVWADASQLCMAPLDDWMPDAVASGGMFMYHSGATARPCSWFIAAAAGSYLLAAWKNATDSFWAAVPHEAKPGSELYPYFWMDQLFNELVAGDRRFGCLWASVPFSDCTAPLGAPATLHGRHHLPVGPELLRSFETAPANTLKLSHHGGPRDMTPEQVAALPAEQRDNTQFVAIRFSQMPRRATPVAAPAAAEAGAHQAAPAAGAGGAGSARQHPGQQHAAIAAFVQALRSRAPGPAGCSVRTYGEGGGTARSLCEPAGGGGEAGSSPDEPFFLSYGVGGDDASLEADLSKRGARGFALDPDADHPSLLAPGVFFLKLAAPAIAGAAEARDPRAAPALAGPQALPVEKLWRWTGHRRVWALLYDCDGCEFALVAEANKLQMLHLFAHVDNFNEIHTHHFFLNSTAHLDGLDRLLSVLHLAGLQLVPEWGPAGCGRDVPGQSVCLPEAVALGLPCEGSDCTAFLFARRPSSAAAAAPAGGSPGGA